MLPCGLPYFLIRKTQLHKVQCRRAAPAAARRLVRAAVVAGGSAAAHGAPGAGRGRRVAGRRVQGPHRAHPGGANFARRQRAFRRAAASPEMPCEFMPTPACWHPLAAGSWQTPHQLLGLLSHSGSELMPCGQAKIPRLTAISYHLWREPEQLVSCRMVLLHCLCPVTGNLKHQRPAKTRFGIRTPVISCMQLFRADDRTARRQQASAELGVDVDTLKTLPRAVRQAAAAGARFAYTDCYAHDANNTCSLPGVNEDCVPRSANIWARVHCMIQLGRVVRSQVQQSVEAVLQSGFDQLVFCQRQDQRKGRLCCKRQLSHSRFSTQVVWRRCRRRASRRKCWQHKRKRDRQWASCCPRPAPADATRTTTDPGTLLCPSVRLHRCRRHALGN